MELLDPRADRDNNGNDDDDDDVGHGDNEEEEEHDSDNVFRSGSESPGFHMVQLPVFEETKQRRATVSGGK